VLLGFSLSGMVQAAEGRILPTRLVLCLDGVAWQDINALQAGVALDKRGHQVAAFKTYLPVSRLISTFPSCSDVAWTEMFGNEPLPGYTRSYFDNSTSQFVVLNGVTSTVKYERQMHFQEENGWVRSRGYAFPNHEFKKEMQDFLHDFKYDSAGIDTYYAMLRTTDSAQHLSADIVRILHELDENLRQLQMEYRAQMGRDLEILILSDHGSNKAGPGKRLPIVRFLKKAGYRVTNSIRNSRDVVAPTGGILSFVEIHNAPSETPNLVDHFVHLEGIDLVLSILPGKTNAFLVCDRHDARALITEDSEKKRYKYTMLSGDPLAYGPLLDILQQQHLLDAEGFASRDSWMNISMTHKYPVALERIARGLNSAALNPATILLSLDNRYVHASFWVFQGSRLIRSSGTHGGLDQSCSAGIVLSNFTETRNMTTSQLPYRFDHFVGRNQNVALSEPFIRSKVDSGPRLQLSEK
jgi:hypothetical protein